MADSRPLADLDDTPIYTIKTVVQITGLTPATLRAWERRYGVLAPRRTDSGYRLYSEQDMAILLWLKNQVDGGVAISRAVALLQMQRRAGQAPQITISLESLPGQQTRRPAGGARSKEAIVHDLVPVLLAFRETEAEELLSEAFALYPIETVVEEIVTPTMVAIGELWHAGEATVVQEHFATAVLRRRLTGLFWAYDQPAAGPLAIAGSAPSEWHDMGILTVALTLRRHGWRVIYLGQNVPVEHLIQEIARLRPQLVCLSAATRDSALELVRVSSAIGGLPEPRPRLIVGGRELNIHPDLLALFPGAQFAPTARALLELLSRK